MSSKTGKQQLISGKSTIKCPTCGASAVPKAYPFCSSRCSDVDLGHWLQGKYAIPAIEAADDTIVEALVQDQDTLVREDDNSESD